MTKKYTQSKKFSKISKMPRGHKNSHQKKIHTGFFCQIYYGLLKCSIFVCILSMLKMSEKILGIRLQKNICFWGVSITKKNFSNFLSRNVSKVMYGLRRGQKIFGFRSGKARNHQKLWVFWKISKCQKKIYFRESLLEYFCFGSFGWRQNRHGFFIQIFSRQNFLCNF